MTHYSYSPPTHNAPLGSQRCAHALQAQEQSLDGAWQSQGAPELGVGLGGIHVRSRSARQGCHLD